MKMILQTIRLLLIILLFFDFFIFLMAHGSGHNIPLKTDLSFGLSGLAIITAVCFVHYLIIKVIK